MSHNPQMDFSAVLTMLSDTEVKGHMVTSSPKEQKTPSSPITRCQVTFPNTLKTNDKTNLLNRLKGKTDIRIWARNETIPIKPLTALGRRRYTNNSSVI